MRTKKFNFDTIFGNNKEKEVGVVLAPVATPTRVNSFIIIHNVIPFEISSFFAHTHAHLLKKNFFQSYPVLCKAWPNDIFRVFF